MAALDAEQIVEQPEQRRQRVGRAGRVGEHLLLGSDRVVVYAQDHHIVELRFRRDGENHLSGAGLQVPFHLLTGTEDSRRFDCHIDSEVSPGKVGGFALGEHLDGLVSDLDSLVCRFDCGIAKEPVCDGVVFQQVSEHLVVGKVVDCDHIDTIPL